MKYFFDTEFIEKSGSLILISIGIISEIGETFYAVTDFDESNPDINPFVKENVIPNLGVTDIKMSRCVLSENILRFLNKDKKPQFYAYYADYDWVALCWIFGTMHELPKHFPHYCMDFKQICYHLHIDSQKMFKAHAKLLKTMCDTNHVLQEHNALFDAMVLKSCFDEVKSQIHNPIMFIP